MTATSLDRQIAPVVTSLINQFGGKYVFRAIKGVHSAELGRSASFWSAGISASAADDSINWPGGDFVAAGVIAERWILITGFIASQNEGWAKVLTVAAEKVTLDKALETEAAGSRIGISLATDYKISGYIGEWEKKYWNGTTILPTDAMVIVDLNAMPEPVPDRWSFFDGEDPASANELIVRAVRKIFSGQLAPMAMVGVRA